MYVLLVPLAALALFGIVKLVTRGENSAAVTSDSVDPFASTTLPGTTIDPNAPTTTLTPLPSTIAGATVTGDTTCPAADGSSPRTIIVRQGTTELHRRHQDLHRRGDHQQGRLHHRARCQRGAVDGQQLRRAGPIPLLRQHHLPSGHPGVRRAVRRPDGYRHGWARLQLRRRTAGGRLLQGRLDRHGQLGPRYQWQPVLHHHRRQRCGTARQLHPVRSGHRRPRHHGEGARRARQSRSSRERRPATRADHHPVRHRSPKPESVDQSVWSREVAVDGHLADALPSFGRSYQRRTTG